MLWDGDLHLCSVEGRSCFNPRHCSLPTRRLFGPQRSVKWFVYWPPTVRRRVYKCKSARSRCADFLHQFIRDRTVFTSSRSSISLHWNGIITDTSSILRALKWSCLSLILLVNYSLDDLFLLSCVIFRLKNLHISVYQKWYFSHPICNSGKGALFDLVLHEQAL
jgi:hypothetical protein